MALVPSNRNRNRDIALSSMASGLVPQIVKGLTNYYSALYSGPSSYQPQRQVYDLPKVPKRQPQASRASAKMTPGPRPNKQFNIQRAPAAIGVSTKSRVPVFNGATNGIRIQHCEYIGPWSYPAGVDAGFSVSSGISLQPGLLSSYPWLSSLAINFEQYKIHKMRIVVRSIVPTSTAGATYVCIDYDSADSAPITKTQFMNNGSASSGSVWETITLDYNPPSSNFVNQRYIRNGNLASNLDIKTYDSGTVYLAVDGSSLGSGAHTLGDIFFEYDVSLVVPILNPNVAPGFALQIAASASAGGFYATAPYTSLGTNLAYIENGATNEAYVYFTQQGRWLVNYLLIGTSTSAPAAISVTEVSGSGDISSASWTALPATGVAGASQMISFIATVTDTSVPYVVKIDGVTNFSAITAASVRIVSYPTPST